MFISGKRSPMKLLKLALGGFDLFEDGRLDVDFFASDRVADGRGVAEVEAPIYTNNVLAFAGINATGKTTALKLMLGALNILAGRSLSQEFLEMAFSFAGDIIELEALFWHEGEYYCLSSLISCVEDGASLGEDRWRFTDETLWVASSVPTKKTLASFDEFKHVARIAQRRRDLAEPSLDFLSDDMSMVTALTRGSRQYLAPSLYSDRQWLRMSEAAIDGSVLKVFDDSIEECYFDEREGDYRLSFKNGTSITVDGKGEFLGSFLSDGTVKGANLVRQAIFALRTGGYLLVDEIENHLNKQLVGLIIDLFESNELNPHGAVLLFSTHYPEILDFIKRKDNVYFFSRDDRYRVRVTLYADKVKRIENKKSEVFLSNYLRGTAPKYAVVRDLKTMIQRLMEEDMR